MAKKVPNIGRATKVAENQTTVEGFFKAYGISKTTHQRWMKRHREYKTIVDSIKAGAPPKKPKWEPPIGAIRQLASKGLTKNQVAAALNVRIETYMKHQRENPAVRLAYDEGKSNGVALVKGKLFDKAMKGDMAAILAFLARHDKELDPEAALDDIQITVTYVDKSMNKTDHIIEGEALESQQLEDKSE